MAKKIGSPRSRREISAATKRILKITKGMTHADAAVMLSLGINDMSNLRQSNSRLSMPMLFKMVRDGRFGITPGPQPTRAMQPEDVRPGKWSEFDGEADD